MTVHLGLFPFEPFLFAHSPHLKAAVSGSTEGVSLLLGEPCQCVAVLYCRVLLHSPSIQAAPMVLPALELAPALLNSNVYVFASHVSWNFRSLLPPG